MPTPSVLLEGKATCIQTLLPSHLSILMDYHLSIIILASLVVLYCVILGQSAH